MHYEKLNEPIEVIAYFAEGMLKPLRFLWREQAHKVRAVHGRWTTIEGRQRTFHYAVEAAGVGQCELALDADKMVWRISAIGVDN